MTGVRQGLPRRSACAFTRTPAATVTLITVLLLAMIAASAAARTPLTPEWSAQTGNTIAARPVVVGGHVYVGSWDGREYAYDESSGAQQWSSYTGKTSAYCGGSTNVQGITSAPAIVGGSAYLGGGGSTWDALDLRTGRLQWSIPTGNNNPKTGGHYNWSSPLVYQGHAYVGIASFCDEPQVQGELLRVNLATHRVDNVFKVVPDGQVGGTIWTSPVVDPATNTIYIATGEPDHFGQYLASAMVALDATTLAVKDWWTLPSAQRPDDGDFSTTPVLFNDAHGRPMIAEAGKNGTLYAFDRTALYKGPVWQHQLAISVGVNDRTGGVFSNGLFDGARLIYAGGQTTVRGTNVMGAVRAFDPTTGAIEWERGLPAMTYGALGGANGLVAIPTSNGSLYLMRDTDGVTQYDSGLTGPPGAPAIFGPVTVADGMLFVGTTDGVMHAFAFPSSATPGGDAARVTGAHCSLSGHTAIGLHCEAANSTCTRLEALPDTYGGINLDTLALREAGTSTGTAVTVRLFLNGACAGGSTLRLRLAGGTLITKSFSPAWHVTAGSVMSVSFSQPAKLGVRLTAHLPRRTR